jgi:hypothetical protein
MTRKELIYNARHMMKTIFRNLVVWSAFLILVGCEAGAQTSPPVEATSPPETIMVEVDQPFTLQVGQEAVLGALRLRVTELRDIRCPSEVVCAEKGFTQVSVNIAEGDQGPQTYLMNSDPFYKADSGVGVSLVPHNGYRIELIEVAPYPERPVDKIPLEDYRVTFVISEDG